jgi:hypothetical protein
MNNGRMNCKPLTKDQLETATHLIQWAKVYFKATESHSSYSKLKRELNSLSRELSLNAVLSANAIKALNLLYKGKAKIDAELQ